MAAPNSPSNWREFAGRAADIYESLLSHNCTLEDAAIFFEQSRTITDGCLRDYLINSASEFGGDPDSILELIVVLKKSTSENDLVRHMHSPRPKGWFRFW